MASSKYRGLTSLVMGTEPSKALFSAAVLLYLLQTATSLWVPLLTRDLINGMGAGLTSGAIVFVIAVLIVQAVAGGFAHYWLGRVGHGVVAGVRRRLFAHLLRLPVPFYDRHQSGELVSRVISDSACLKSLITDHLVSFISGLIMILGSVVILWVLDWKMTLVLFTSVIVAVMIVVPIALRLHGIAKSLQDETASFTARLSQVLSEIRLVKASQAEGFEEGTGDQAVEKLFALGLRESRIQSLMAPIISVAIMGALVAILGYGGARVTTGELTVGALMAFILYLFNIVMPMVQFSYFFAELQKAAGAAERAAALLQRPTEQQGGGAALSATSEALRFEEVTFTYAGGEGPILRDFDLTIQPNQVTAIVGPSGSGKSTLLALIERFYQPDAGALFLGDQPLSGLSLASWRNQLGYVSQDCPILSGSLRENIVYGVVGPVSESHIREAITAAHAADFIEALPEGLTTEVGERGVKLSGGQRQRIAIARALLKNPTVLMLDEATSSLDSDAEEKVQRALANLKCGRTTLVVAHRLATVVDADHIVVLEKGKVTGQGTHDQLLAEHEFYQRLVAQQFRSLPESKTQPVTAA